MGLGRRIGLAATVWALRLAAMATLVPWFVRTHQYERTDTRERTYFALGWPDDYHWLASEVVLQAPEKTVNASGDLVPNYLRPRGPLTVWDPEPRSTGVGDEFRHRQWRRANPLYGPILPTGVGAVLWAVAAYVNQFRRRPTERPEGEANP